MWFPLQDKLSCRQSGEKQLCFVPFVTRKRLQANSALLNSSEEGLSANCGRFSDEKILAKRKRRYPSADWLSAPKPQCLDGFHQTLGLIEAKAPAAYKAWLQTQQQGEDAYVGTPVHSCSVSGHKHAALFRMFVDFHARTNVLDIGCGPQPVPSYLTMPLSAIAGIDPIASHHPFTFYRGLAEWLPWENETFRTIVIGTSLDHFLLLDEAFKEISRVLQPDGRVLVWVTFRKERSYYDPYGSDKIVPIDKYHLFSFQEKSWNALISSEFEEEERFDLSCQGIQESFYSLQKRIKKNSGS